MKIIKAKEKDSVEISKIYAQSWKIAYKNDIPKQYLDNLKEDFWVETFNEWLSTNKVEALLAYKNNKPVGCIAYSSGRDDEYKTWGEIISLYSLEEVWGTKVGYELISAAVKNLYENKYYNIYLWVLNENERAKNFYKRFGFIETDDELHFEIQGKKLFDKRFIYKHEK